jgi:arginine decarboxylase-like protein
VKLLSVAEIGAQSGQLGAKLRDLALQAGEAIRGGHQPGVGIRARQTSGLWRGAEPSVISAGHRDRSRHGAATQQLLESLLLLARAALVAGDLAALDETVQRGVDLG